jgi:hypothetical protein
VGTLKERIKKELMSQINAKKVGDPQNIAIIQQ